MLSEMTVRTGMTEASNSLRAIGRSLNSFRRRRIKAS
jgi:hypothetical protein